MLLKDDAPGVPGLERDVDDGAGGLGLMQVEEEAREDGNGRPHLAASEGQHIDEVGLGPQKDSMWPDTEV